MPFPALSKRAAYLTIDNARKRNALSLAVLRNLRDQLNDYSRAANGEVNILPEFKPSILDELEAVSVSSDFSKSKYSWLLDVQEWQKQRQGLPNVLVLRTDGPVFSAGHDLAELKSLSYEEVKETFALCAEVMSLIRRSPAPVVAVIQGLATAAGAQLAFTTDFPIATKSTKFQLPGASIGLPCTSPSTAVGRKLGPAFTYRMLALAEAVEAKDLPGGAVEVVDDEAKLELRVQEVVEKLADRTAGQPNAFGKWAYWTQMSFDQADDATRWAGRVMALHARCEDAKEGTKAFFEKRQPTWRT